MSNNDTLVIIPVFNESNNLEDVIKNLCKYFKNILIVDDGSDHSYDDILEKRQCEIFKTFNKSRSRAALHTGFTFFYYTFNLIMR